MTRQNFAACERASRVPTCVVSPVLAMLSLASPAMAQPTIVDLGTLPGTIESFSTGLSADGSVVVGYCVVDYFEGNSLAFRWTPAGGMQNLGGLPGGAVSSHGFDISADGSVLVGVAGALAIAPRAWRWTSGGGMQSLGFMSGGTNSWATGVSANGLVVVGYGDFQNSGWNRAFRWTSGGGMQHLGTLPGGNLSRAYAVSADGSVVTGFSNGTGTGGDRAIRWTGAGGMQNLGTLPGGWRSQGWAISADGSVIAGVSSGTGFSEQAMRWTSAGGMQHLGVLPGGFYSSAGAMSPEGSILLGRSNGSGFPNWHAILWTAELGMIDLNTWLVTRGVNLTGWELENATAISADGSALCGEGLFNGEKRAWLVSSLNDTPCPGDLDADGAISLSDLATLLSHFGTPGGANSGDGDLDADGDVDLGDLALFLADFGSTCP